MTIFISDTHLGNKYSQAGRFYTWLDTVRAEHESIYLVGDIVDDSRQKDWSYAHKNALFSAMDFQFVYYTPGNHDNFFREIGPMELGHVCIANQFDFVTNGKRYLVIHGDQFDWLMKLAFISSRFIHSPIRHWFSGAHTIFSGKPDDIIAYAKEHGYDGVISGHTHEPEISVHDGIEYINCGDWVVACSAVIEKDGKFELVYG